jgi:hypothetical protein
MRARQALHTNVNANATNSIAMKPNVTSVNGSAGVTSNYITNLFGSTYVGLLLQPTVDIVSHRDRIGTNVDLVTLRLWE